MLYNRQSRSVTTASATASTGRTGRGRGRGTTAASPQTRPSVDDLTDDRVYDVDIIQEGDEILLRIGETTRQGTINRVVVHTTSVKIAAREGWAAVINVADSTNGEDYDIELLDWEDDATGGSI